MLKLVRDLRGRHLLFGLAVLLGLAAVGAAAQTRPRFQPEPGDWTVMGEDARLAATREGSAAPGGRAGVEYRYRVGKGLVSLLVLPVPRGRLDGAAGIRFSARASHLAALSLSVEEQGGGRWTTSVTLREDRWQDVQIAFSDLVLAVGGDAPADANGRLDLERVQRISVVDMGAMLSSASPKMMQLFGIDAGERRLLIANFGVDSSPVASGGDRIDGFDRATAPWSVFGAADAQLGTESPLRQPGLVIAYRKGKGRVMSAIRQIAVGSLAEGSAIEVVAASRIETTLMLKVEQQDGGKYEASFKLPAGGALQTVQLRAKDFKRSDDSSSKAGQPDWPRVSNLILLDIGGLFTAGNDNQIWLQSVAATGGVPALAGAKREAGQRSANSTPMERSTVVGWASWNKRSTPVLSGPFSLVGDPSVIRDGAQYRMAYTCYDPKRKGPAVCGATSGDGLEWTDVTVPGPLPGRLVETRAGKWDDTHETPFLLKFNGEYLLYFTGYRNRGGHFKSFPLQLGMARSRDGVNFERVSDEPIIKVSPDGYDSDAIFSPTIVEHEGELVMLYTAYCLDNCKREKGVYLMAATSRNGRDWVKRDKPVLSKTDVKTEDGAAEAEVVKGPDGLYYLFASLLYGGERGHDIGVAWAETPFGPWRFAAESVVRRTAGSFDDIGPIAPSVLIEGDKVRMWFHGFSKRKTIQIGYAESAWPLRTGR